MKKIFRIAAVAAVLAALLAFVSCKNDDDDDSGGSGTPVTLASSLANLVMSDGDSSDPRYVAFRDGKAYYAKYNSSKELISGMFNSSDSPESITFYSNNTVVFGTESENPFRWEGALSGSEITSLTRISYSVAGDTIFTLTPVTSGSPTADAVVQAGR